MSQEIQWKHLRKIYQRQKDFSLKNFSLWAILILSSSIFIKSFYVKTALYEINSEQTWGFFWKTPENISEGDILEIQSSKKHSIRIFKGFLSQKDSLTEAESFALKRFQNQHLDSVNIYWEIQVDSISLLQETWPSQLYRQYQSLSDQQKLEEPRVSFFLEKLKEYWPDSELKINVHLTSSQVLDSNLVILRALNPIDSTLNFYLYEEVKGREFFSISL